MTKRLKDLKTSGSRIIISNVTRNLCHSRPETHASPHVPRISPLSPLSFIPTVPYPPLRGTFPSRGRLRYGGNGILIFYLFPPSYGRRCPEGAEVGSRSGMKRNVRQSVLSYRHPERSRGIFTPWRCTAHMRERENRISAVPHLTLSV